MNSKLKVLIENQIGIQKIIDIVDKTQNQKKLYEFIGNKTIQSLNKVMEERLGRVDNLNTNESYFDEYKNNNVLQITDKGFTITNDTMANFKEYPFSIALAFEFGTGIVGAENPVNGAWEYNVNNYTIGWWFYDRDRKRPRYTIGYHGMEIYRYTAEEINKNIQSWLNEYMEG